MIDTIYGRQVEFSLDENGKLGIKGLLQFTDWEKKQILSYMKVCKGEIIGKIKAGIEIVPIPTIEKPSVCIDSMPCKHIGLNSDDTGTYPVCLYNNQPIHEKGFICPLANERIYKALGIETDKERFNRLYGRFKPKVKAG
ncbi:MAG: hypothetical protein RBR08_11365 [Desulforegulaceae bacterium]|nr:hypothetical protein [Desulforegulaceae bacterium]